VDRIYAVDPGKLSNDVVPGLDEGYQSNSSSNSNSNININSNSNHDDQDPP